MTEKMLTDGKTVISYISKRNLLAKIVKAFFA